jgi:PAS domain S-box-containing protein
MKTKILIIEHDSNNMELIHHELEKGDLNYSTQTVGTKKAYEKAIHIFQPDIILSNFTFPTFNSLIILQIRENLVPETPFIFISESIDKENADALIKNGLTDFVLKKRLFTLIDKMNQALHKVELAKLNKLLKQSELKRTEELAQNESNYKSLIESCMDAILLTVTDGQILSANAAACLIFQMTEDEICNAGRFDIVDGTDPRLQILLDERDRTGRAKGELTFKRKDGSKFPGEISSVVYTDTCGQKKTSMTIKDLTEQKQAEDKQIATSDALQKAVNDLNNILDSSLDVICSNDKEGQFVSVNAASEDIWGYKPLELIGKKYMDFIFHEDIEKTISADTTIRGGEPVTIFENRYIHKDGSIAPVLWSSRWDEKDQLFYSVAKNATEKKKLEKAFEFERKRFHDLYSQAPSCMGILKGPNHVYELANDLYLQLIDRNKDIIGKTVKEVLPELEAQGFFEFLDTVYKTGETFSANEMLVKFDFHGNGKLVDTYRNFIYQAHRNNDGDIDGILFFANDVTEQVLSRTKIEESVLRYTSLIEQAGDAICFIDSSMNITEVNQYACEKLGYSKTEILQLSIDDFFLEEDLKAKPLKVDLLKEGKSVRGERRIKSKNGSLIEVDISAKMLKNGIFLIFIRDISEQKKAQRAVVESEKKYRQIVETAQEGIWLIDQNHHTTFVNNKMCEILEYAQEEMMGKEIYSFMDEEGKKIAAKLMKRKKEGQPDQKHFKYTSKSGKEIWTNVVANPLFDETGLYKGSLTMVTDITEIKKAQQNLKENEKKYRYLFNNNPMPMWVIDLVTFEFLDVNNMATLQYGYSREEFLSMTVLDIRPETDRDDFKKLRDPSEINASNFNRGIWNHKKKNGTVIPVEIIAHEIMYEGIPARFILSSDITDRTLAALNLEKQNKQLIKTNSELDRFVYSVSHDLRSPLTSILGLLSFIETESLENDTLEHAGMIRRSVNRLDDFIKNILSYSRNNRIRLEIEKVPVQQTVIAIVESLQSMKDAKGIVFDIDIEEQHSFYTDSLRFKTIMENLISNAIKHHKKEGSDRYIKITGHSDNEKLQLTIADNGIGIAPENHKKIFDMFFRLSGKTDGSGIGLYIVRETIEKLQGFIEVESELETGTTFIITLKNLKP